MSHSVKITLIADQKIELMGDIVNIHDLSAIYLDGKGYLVGYSVHPDKAERLNIGPEGGFVDAGTTVFKFRKAEGK